MACNVFVYTDALNPLHPPQVDVLAIDQHNGKTFDTAATTPLPGPEAIATLPKLPRKVVCSVFAHDRSMKWSSSTVENLNGAVLNRIDVVLYPLPGGGAGPTRARSVSSTGVALPPTSGVPPKQALEVDQYIEDQPWAAGEKAAVRSIIRSFGAIVNAPDTNLQRIARAMAQWLTAIGIDAKIVTPIVSRRQPPPTATLAAAG